MLHFNKNTLAGLLAAIMLLTLIMPISLSLSALDEGVSETYLRFEEYGDTSSGTCILVAEYGGKVYAMGNAVVEGQGEDGEKVGYGFEAVEVETLANGEIRVSCDDASICVFTHETVGTKTYIKMSDGTYLNYTDNGLVATGYENLAYFADSLVNGGDFSTCIRLTVKYGEKEITPYFSYVTDTLASQFTFASPFAKDSIYYELAYRSCNHTCIRAVCRME